MTINLAEIKEKLKNYRGGPYHLVGGGWLETINYLVDEVDRLTAALATYESNPIGVGSRVLALSDIWNSDGTIEGESFDHLGFWVRLDKKSEKGSVYFHRFQLIGLTGEDDEE